MVYFRRDVTFAKFVSDYATLEDEIRTAWLLIGKEQETMLVRTLYLPNSDARYWFPGSCRTSSSRQY
jgi:hypothetical protein